MQEKIQKEEEAEAEIDMQLAQNATHAKIVKDLNIEVTFRTKIFMFLELLSSRKVSKRYVYMIFFSNPD